jgi:NADH-quinone oxidoreductase subunit C
MSDVTTSKHFNKLSATAREQREKDIEVQHRALEIVQRKYGDKILSADTFRDDVTITIKPEDLIEVLKTLRDHEELKYNFLSSITGIDYSRYDCPASWGDIRFGVVYNLLSMENQANFMVRTVLPEENPEAPSLCHMWRTADWQEREIYDLLGITFTEHPDLRRLLLYDDFEGEHPLRKDYPLQGKGERDRSWKKVQRLARGEEA